MLLYFCLSCSWWQSNILDLGTILNWGFFGFLNFSEMFHIFQKWHCLRTIWWLLQWEAARNVGILFFEFLSSEFIIEGRSSCRSCRQDAFHHQCGPSNFSFWISNKLHNLQFKSLIVFWIFFSFQKQDLPTHLHLLPLLLSSPYDTVPLPILSIIFLPAHTQMYETLYPPHTNDIALLSWGWKYVSICYHHSKWTSSSSTLEDLYFRKVWAFMDVNNNAG